MRTTMDRSNLWAWGHQVWWGSQGGKKKRKERGWAKKHQGRVREVSKYVQVFCSPFFPFCFLTMKDSRLEDLWIVTVWFARRGRRWATEGWVQKAPVGESAGSYRGLLNQKWLTSWEVFTPLHWHAEFATHFYIKLFFTKCSRSQWSWILTYLPLKWRALSLHAAVGDCSKTRCIYKALSFCLQTKHA